MNAQRLEAVRTKIHAARLDAFLVTFLPHVRYLTDFSGSSGLCVLFPDRQYFVSDGRYKAQSADEVGGFRIVIGSGGMFEEIKKKKILRPKARIGVEVQHMSVAELENLRVLFPRAKFVLTRGIVESVASVKDESEIEAIKRATAITDGVFQGVLPLIKEGVTEIEIAAEILYRHRKAGAEAEAFEPIVASGPRGALPHARATTKKIKTGELVTLDLGCRYGGYHSDLTRTVALGNPTAEAKTMYAIVLSAQERAIGAARSGLKARALDAVARGHIRKAGYGKFFTHSLGHGLGLQVHEMPRISALSHDVLETGNVITIEPGIYVPGIGGVRIEDDVVIRNDGCEILNKAPKQLMVL